jgi:hypothetical protein
VPSVVVVRLALDELKLLLLVVEQECLSWKLEARDDKGLDTTVLGVKGNDVVVGVVVLLLVGVESGEMSSTLLLDVVLLLVVVREELNVVGVNTGESESTVMELEEEDNTSADEALDFICRRNMGSETDIRFRGLRRTMGVEGMLVMWLCFFVFFHPIYLLGVQVQNTTGPQAAGGEVVFKPSPAHQLIKNETRAITFLKYTSRLNEDEP